MRMITILIAGGGLLIGSVPASAKEPPNLGPVTSAPVSDMSAAYGRAGGLTGPQRVQESQIPEGPPVRTGLDWRAHVLATWSEGVAKRTHMPLAASTRAAEQHPFRAPRKPKY